MSGDEDTNRPNDPTPGAGPSWTRRDLLIRGGQTVVVAGVGAGAAAYLYDPKGDAGLQPPPPIRLKDYFAPLDFPTASPRISAAYGPPDSIDDADMIERMTRAAIEGLDAQGIGRFVSSGDVVLIKPNVGFDRGPGLGATTNPQVVRALIRMCRQARARQIVVADNPIENPPACFARSGIQAAAEQEGAAVVIHSSAHDAPVQVRPGPLDPDRGEALATWPIFWKPLQLADKVIGVAPIKDHNLCYASMTMKNWYGLLGGRRNQFHQAIHSIVSDLAFMMSPTLVIADGTRVMMRNGPTGGRLDDIRVGGISGRPVIVAGVDQIACDSWCYQKLLGRDPAALSYLDLAYRKLGGEANERIARSWQDYDRQGKIVEKTV